MRVPFLSFLAALGLLVLAGCTAAPTLLGTGPRPGDEGTAMVTISGWTRAAQAVASDVSTVSVSVSPVGGNPFFGKRKEVAGAPGGSTTTAFTGLTAGQWRVEAVALGATRATLGTATADVSVQAGQTTAVTLTLKLVPTNGVQIDLGLRNGYVRWDTLMPEAREAYEVAQAFEDTSLGSGGNEWRYMLADATGTRSATYSVVFDELSGTTDLVIDVEGRDTTTRYVDDKGEDDLHAMPLGAQLVATGSETVLGAARPYRKFAFTLRYPYPGDRWVQVTTIRWVTPGIGTYREETVDEDDATSSLELTGYTVMGQP